MGVAVAVTLEEALQIRELVDEFLVAAAKWAVAQALLAVSAVCNDLRGIVYPGAGAVLCLELADLVANVREGLVVCRVESLGVVAVMLVAGSVRPESLAEITVRSINLDSVIERTLAHASLVAISSGVAHGVVRARRTSA